AAGGARTATAAASAAGRLPATRRRRLRTAVHGGAGQANNHRGGRARQHHAGHAHRLPHGTTRSVGGAGRRSTSSGGCARLRSLWLNLETAVRQATDNAPMTDASMDATPFPNAPLHRPTWAFALAHPARFIALGAGSGLPRFAPGTVGTLWAWAVFLLLEPWLSD